MVASMIQLISNRYWHLKSKIRNFPPTTASTFLNFKGKPWETNRFNLTWQWLKTRSYTNPVVTADCPTWSALWGPIAAYPPLPTLVWYSFLTVTCLISLMDRGFGAVIAKLGKGSIPVQAWNFFLVGFFFNRLGCSFYCEDHVHFHITTMLHDCWSLLLSLGD